MYEQAARGVREGPVGGRIVVVAILSVVVVTAIVAIAVALGVHPPGTVLTGTTWQWTASTTGARHAEVVVPDPATYTIEFRSDRTFQAKADCNAISGTYRSVLAGRTGSASTGLRLTPEPSSPVACGAGSLSDVYARDLEKAARYVIADAQLTIMLSDGGRMTFQVGDAVGP